MTDTFQFQIEDGIGLLTLTQAPRNTLDHRFFGEFHAWSESVLAHIALQGLVVIGQGKHFSAGADTAELGRILRGKNQQPSFLLENSRAF